MNREDCENAAKACLKMAWQAKTDDERETYVKIAQTWAEQAEIFDRYEKHLQLVHVDIGE